MDNINEIIARQAAHASQLFADLEEHQREAQEHQNEVDQAMIDTADVLKQITCDMAHDRKENRKTSLRSFVASIIAIIIATATLIVTIFK